MNFIYSTSLEFTGPIQMSIYHIIVLYSLKRALIYLIWFSFDMYLFNKDCDYQPANLLFIKHCIGQSAFMTILIITHMLG